MTVQLRGTATVENAIMAQLSEDGEEPAAQWTMELGSKAAFSG
jgi:hypothetical protein